jgi:hypothetical protein
MKNLINNVDHIQNIAPAQNIFYRAVVEDNNDGGKGKVRVRVLGVHSEINKRTGKNMGVPVDELPWAEIMAPANVHGGNGTYGKTGIPLQGTWVWVFFDGGDWNRPVISGIIYGGETKKPTGSVGFEDPDAVYPEADKIEDGTTRTSANRKVGETGIISVKDANRDIAIPTATGYTHDEEKEQTTGVSYPLNESQAWTDGSFWEHDVTAGGRTHWFHNSGTYTEVLPSGAHTLNVVDNQKVIVYKNSERLVKINETHTVQGESLYKIDLKRTIIVGGDSKEVVMGKTDEKYMSGQDTFGGPYIHLTAGIITLN